jgi:hypothetical protein
MDIARIFENLPQWARNLDANQAALLDQLMEATTTKGFSGIPVEEMRRIQEHLLRASEDAERQCDMKRAAQRLDPVISGTVFI